jgi:ABC-type Na+ efflux pump permease subunit
MTADQPYAAAPAPGPAPAPAGTDYPGKILGIVGLVLAFVFNVAGIVVSAIALSQSKKAGFKNTPAKIGLILSIIFFVLSIIGIALAVAGIVAGAGALQELCEGMDPGTYPTTNGSSITCP